MRVLDSLRSPVVALDVGTSTTRLCWSSGNIVEHRTVVRENVRGTTVVRRAMRAGVVADIEGVAGVVRSLLANRRRIWARRPSAVVCAPTDVSSGERDALVEAVAEGGASVVEVVPEPLAAAVGAGIDLSSEYASTVIDIGDGVTDLAIFRNATMVRTRASRIGCGTLRSAVNDWVELQHGLEPLDDETVDMIVRHSCRMKAPAATMIHHPAGVRLSLQRDELESLLDPVIDEIAMFIADTIRDLPPALGVEVIESGIHVTGGGANLDRLVQRIESRVGLPITRAHEPLNAVIRGAGEMLRHRLRS